MFPLKIIFFIIFFSGLIAFLGDRIGHYIGRKRLTLLKLRPRLTANIFSVITGILIALSAIAFLLIISSTARTAFFESERLKTELKNYETQIKEKNEQIQQSSQRLEELKNSEKNLQEKIENLKTEKISLSRDVEKLKVIVEELLSSLKSVRAGEIFVRVNDILLTQIIPGGHELESEKVLKEMLSLTDSQLRIKAKLLGQEIPANQRIIWLSQEELKEALNFIKNHPNSLAVRVLAGQNAAVGEVVVVHLEIFENQLIFKKGEIIGETKIEKTLAEETIAKKIQAALKKVRQTAEKKGLLPDKKGAVGTIPYEKFYRLIQEVKNSPHTLVNLKIAAQQNIYTSGPMDLLFIIDGTKI